MEYYNLVTLLRRSLIANVELKEIDKLVDKYYYYDFDTKTYLQCSILHTLPYDLYAFHVDNLQDNTECIVTCMDSYRLHKDSAPEVDHDKMVFEKEWRDELVRIGAEVDWKNKKCEWIKCEVGWVKEDIIPGVLAIGKHKIPNVNFFGYYYKESTKFAKSCTHTDIITDIELSNEKRLDIEFKEKEDIKDKIVNLWKTKLGMKCPMKYVQYANKSGSLGKMGFIDVLPFYQSLKKYPAEINENLIRKNPRVDGDYVIKTLTNNSISLMTVGLVLTEHDVVYTSHISTPKLNKTSNSYITVLDKADGFFDIKVYYASYAYLTCKNNKDEYDCKVKLEIEDDYHILPDITYENPLFRGMYGSELRIDTDGTSVIFKSLLLNNTSLDIIYGFKNSYALSHFPSLGKIFMYGHAWQPSMLVPYTDLVEIQDI